MPAFVPQRGTSLLIGIGLVLVGLLAGILAMLYMDGDDRTARLAPEHVELGRPPDRTRVFAEDSTAVRVDVGMSRLNVLFQSVAQRVTPSVVYIQVRMAEEQGPSFFPPMRQSVGSGVVIGRDGYIVTNYHVIKGAESIEVTLADKRRFEADLVGADPSTDLAVIKIDGQTPPIVLGDSDEVQVGEWIIAVGNPFRLRSTVTAGIISALGRQVNIIEDEFRIENFIQTDAAINPGNSGGALVNLEGELVGIATAIATESGSYEGYGFAVPVNLVERVAHDLIAYGEVRRGYLGVRIQGVNEALAHRLELGRIGGVYVHSVQPGAAADRAGLRQGDVVLAVEGQRVNAANDLQSAIARHRPGERVKLTVWRGGRKRAFTVRLDGRDDTWVERIRRETSPPPSVEERPEAPIFELDTWGLGVRDLTGRERGAFDVTEGVYLAYVRRGSPPARAGLPNDVVLTHIAGEAVDTVEEVRRVLEAHRKQTFLLLRIEQRNGIPAFYEIETPSGG